MLIVAIGRRPRPPGGRTPKSLTQTTSRRLETSMDDYVAAVTAAVAAYRRLNQRIKNINQLALIIGLLDVEDVVLSREHI